MPPKRCSSATGWSLRCPLSNPGSLPASALPLSVCFSHVLLLCFPYGTNHNRAAKIGGFHFGSFQTILANLCQGRHALSRSSREQTANFVIDFINFSQFVQTLFKPQCYHDPCPKGERQSSRKAGKPRLFHFTTPPFCRLPSPGAGAFLSCGIGSPKAQCDNDSTFSAAFCVLKILHSGHIPFTLCPNQRHNRLLFCNHQKDDGFHLLNETAILFHKRFPLGNRS